MFLKKYLFAILNEKNGKLMIKKVFCSNYSIKSLLEIKKLNLKISDTEFIFLKKNYTPLSLMLALFIIIKGAG